MRVLLVNDAAVPVGGAERMTLLLRDGLRRRGHDVRVLASSAGASSQAGGSFADFSCFGATRPRAQMLARTFNPSAAVAMSRALRSFRPDVVHVRMYLQQLSPAILPALRRVPSLYHAVMYESICPTGLKLLPRGDVCRSAPGWVCHRDGCLSWPAWAALNTQLALRKRLDPFRLVVANSRSLGARLAAEGVDGPLDVVPNGVPTLPARPPLADPPTVGFAGRLTREKGADVLLRAFRRLCAAIPDARLVVAGDGPERPALEALAGRLDVAASVQFTGQLDSAELERVLAGAWVQAVPSRWDEPFGLVAAEALMRGTAVVYSDAGGLGEVAEAGVSGIPVPPADPGALADGLARVLSNRDVAERMGAAGRQRALAHFTEQTFVERFSRLYEQLNA